METDTKAMSLQDFLDNYAKEAFGYQSWESLKIAHSMTYGRHEPYWLRAAEAYKDSCLAAQNAELEKLRKDKYNAESKWELYFKKFNEAFAIAHERTTELNTLRFYITQQKAKAFDEGFGAGCMQSTGVYTVLPEVNPYRQDKTTKSQNT